jgi:hypothetical protein
LKILNFDYSRESRNSFIAFCKSLESPGQIVTGPALAAICAPDDTASNVVIVIAHGAPYPADLEVETIPSGISVIRIGISNSDPSLAISAGFSPQRVANFEWPYRAGNGLKELGGAIARNLSALEREQPDKMLATIVDFFKGKFELDDPITAYLLKVACGANLDQFADELEKLELGRFKGKSADELLSLLDNRIPKAPM